MRDSELWQILRLAQTILIGLKLTYVIDWQWVWVLTPMWILTTIHLFLAIVTKIFKNED